MTKKAAQKAGEGAGGARRRAPVDGKPARPTVLNDAIAEAVCDRIAEGGQESSLRAIEKDEAMPLKKTVLQWLKESAPFRAQYADARARQADAMSEEIIEIVDDSGLDITGVNEKTGQPIVDGEAIARARLRYDARRWLMGKLAPKKYGDKIEVKQGGEVIIKHKWGG